MPNPKRTALVWAATLTTSWAVSSILLVAFVTTVTPNLASWLPVILLGPVIGVVAVWAGPGLRRIYDEQERQAYLIRQQRLQRHLTIHTPRRPLDDNIPTPQ